MTSHATTFEALRPRLLGIASRTLASAADADDVVQDAWLRWQRTDRTAVRDGAAFLATTTRRLALNVAQSARVRRETAGDPWLAEAADVEADPTLAAERRDALALAVRTLMARLSRRECAAFVLREGFGYPYRQIAAVLETSEASARQLVTRARVRLAGEPRRRVSSAEQGRLIVAVSEAAGSGDLTELEHLLAAGTRGSTGVSDGCARRAGERSSESSTSTKGPS